jgi:hypothetical protein
MISMMEIKPPKKMQKFPQHIWLDADVYRWIIDLASEKGVAPNVICSQLLRAIYEGQKTGKINAVITVEKPIEIYRCLFCEYKTQKLAEIIDHISEKHRDKLRELAL